MSCFVTVGTTSFDALVEALDDERVRDCLFSKHGIKHLTIQFGRGEYEPKTEDVNLTVETFRFKPTLSEEMRHASLIISHAGAGSVMEGLRQHKPMVVVVNDSLMDNHQVELASALGEANYLVYAPSPRLLLGVLENSQQLSSLQPYPKRDAALFGAMLDSEMGF